MCFPRTSTCCWRDAKTGKSVRPCSEQDRLFCSTIFLPCFSHILVVNQPPGTRGRAADLSKRHLLKNLIATPCIVHASSSRKQAPKRSPAPQTATSCGGTSGTHSFCSSAEATLVCYRMPRQTVPDFPVPCCHSRLLSESSTNPQTR